MTTTSQPVRVRRPAPEPRDRIATYGSPRSTRERRRGWAVATLIGLPFGIMTAIGATVISSYHDHLRPEPGAAHEAGPAQIDATPTGADAELMAHAPTGADVGTSGLDAQLTRAITRARAAAAKDGVTISIVSGHRSAATQQGLYDAAIKKYGSAAEASKWVLPPQDSAHVKGKAVDVGPYAAASWLQKNGQQFGLCRRYANEYWHFEVLAPAKGEKCPALEADASADATG